MAEMLLITRGTDTTESNNLSIKSVGPECRESHEKSLYFKENHELKMLL